MTNEEKKRKEAAEKFAQAVRTSTSVKNLFSELSIIETYKAFYFSLYLEWCDMERAVKTRLKELGIKEENMI